MPNRPRSTDRQALQLELPLFSWEAAAPAPAAHGAPREDNAITAAPARPEPAALAPAAPITTAAPLTPPAPHLTAAPAANAPVITPTIPAVPVPPLAPLVSPAAVPAASTAPDAGPASDATILPGPTAVAPNYLQIPTTTITPDISGEKLRRIVFADMQPLDYLLRRSRRRSIGFVIDERGLTVTAPRWVTLAQIEEAIREKQRWILTRIAEMRNRRSLVPGVRWEDGGTLPYLGTHLTLRIVQGAARGETVRIAVERAELQVSLPPAASAQQLKDRVQGWLQAEAKKLFTERLEVYAERLGIRHRVLRLSSASTRWGSCSADGKILLNWRLVHFPLSSIDYVVAHELAHLKEMNHGPRFWQTVAQLLPGFESARAHLKNPPPELLPQL